MKYGHMLSVLLLTGSVQTQELALSIPEPDSTNFGASVVVIGDVNGDGIADIAAGSHRFHLNGEQGRFSMYSGADGQVIWSKSGNQIGSVIAAPGDINGDGIPDVTVERDVYSGSDGQLLRSLTLGFSVASGIRYFGDVNGDGESDLLIENVVFSGLNGNGLYTLPFETPFTSYNSLAGAPGDINGDGVPDILTPSEGEALFLSGVNGSLLRSDAIPGSIDQPLMAIDDFNGDGELDYVAPGSPTRVLCLETGEELYSTGDHDARQATALGDYNGNGTPDFALVDRNDSDVYIYEGSNGSLITVIAPVALTYTLDAMGDRNGDGLGDLVVGAPNSFFEGNDNVPGGLMGVLRIYNSDLAPVPYCTAKLNSLGCSPSIGLIGNSCISDPGPMEVLVTDVLNQKPGLFFYGFASANLPFLGGTLCVGPPLRRTPITFSFGSPPPANDCSGAAGFDLKQWILAGSDALLVPGTDVFLQHWSRDPGLAAPNDVGLTGGLSLTLCP